MINTLQKPINSQITDSQYLYISELGLYIDVRTITPQEAKEILAGQIKKQECLKCNSQKICQANESSQVEN